MVNHKSLFDGESYKAEFAIIIYRWFMSRRWVTYADIMADRLGCSTEELPANLSNCDGYGELKKAVGIVKKLSARRLVTIALKRMATIEINDSVTSARTMILSRTCETQRLSTIFVSTGSSARILQDSSQSHGWSTFQGLSRPVGHES